MSTLLNKKNVKRIALEVAKESRSHEFTRVSSEFIEKMDFKLRIEIQRYITSIPSKGKTI